jgi:riboflavin kinase/FMN adenylyltransferase
MQVHYDLNSLPEFKNSIITVGTFDGVHHAHRELISQIQREATMNDSESVIITFHPHPRSIVQPETPIELLTSINEKINLIEKLGVNHLVIVPFTKEFSQLTARDYIEKFLIKYFKPSYIVIGYNHQFGHHRDGNIELLQKLSTVYHYKVEEINKQLLNDIEVSSSRIRIALKEGDIKTANELLASPYQLIGEVIEGKQLGRTLGFPTANIKINDSNKLIPSIGVYAVTIKIKDQFYKGMMNIGKRPTVNGINETIEVNIFDFDSDIYNSSITIYLIERIRDEIKFSSLDELKNQLALDKEIVKSLLNI